MDLVHETVNRATLQSTVDSRTERGWSSPECGHAGVPVLGTLPWQHGEQEERMGILTLVARVGGGARTARRRRREAAAEQAQRGGARGAKVRRGDGK
jgi:hypothetical protein